MGYPLVQSELAVDRLELRRLDQLAMRDLNGVQRAFQPSLPEFQKALQLRKLGEQVVFLPDITLQEPLVIGPPIKNPAIEKIV